MHLNRSAFDFALAMRGMNKTEVADAAGKNLSFISDLTYGRYGASAPTAKAIADALRCPIDMLFPEQAGFAAPNRQFANASDALVWLDHCRTLVLDELAKRDAAQTAATPECPEPDALTAADIDQLQNADVEAAR